MSDEAIQPDADAQEPVVPEPKSFDEAYVKQLRDEAAGYRVKLKSFEDRDKSDADMAADRIAELERENAGFKSQAERGEWLREAAIATGLPADALDVIRGDDRETFIAAAQKLKSLIPEPTEEPAPKKGAWAPFDPDEGKSPSSKTEPASAGMGTLRAAYAQAESKGDS